MNDHNHCFIVFAPSEKAEESQKMETEATTPSDPAAAPPAPEGEDEFEARKKIHLENIFFC